jgi:hypothetical protein
MPDFTFLLKIETGYTSASRHLSLPPIAEVSLHVFFAVLVGGYFKG